MLLLLHKQEYIHFLVTLNLTMPILSNPMTVAICTQLPSFCQEFGDLIYQPALSSSSVDLISNPIPKVKGC